MANKEKVVKTDKQKKPGFFAKIGNFFKGLKSEFKKIVWPNFRTVMKNTLIVFLMCAAVGLFIWLIDFGLDALLKLIYK
jgi:preprotein translocase subunit SecE